MDPVELLKSVRGGCLLSIALAVTVSCGGFETTPQAFRELPFNLQSPAGIEFLEVNGVKVQESEFLLVAQMEAAEIVNYFLQTHGVSADTDFWSKSFHDDSPRQRLLRRSLIKVVEIQIVYALSQEYGIRQDLSFDSLLRRWEVENLVRQEALEKGVEIHGPARYSLVDYLRRDLASLRLALMQILEERDLLRGYESSWLSIGRSSRRERMEQAFHRFLDERVKKARVLGNRDRLLSLEVPAFETGEGGLGNESQAEQEAGIPGEQDKTPQ